MESKKCWVCSGDKPKLFGYRCETHDVCDICAKNRHEIKGDKLGTITGFVCVSCEEKRQQKAISDFGEEEVDNWTFSCNDNVKCPYCGHEYEPDELHESTDDEECGNCGSIMNVEVEYSVSYSTSKLGE